MTLLLVALGGAVGVSLLTSRLAERRGRLAALLAGMPTPLTLCPQTTPARRRRNG